MKRQVRYVAEPSCTSGEEEDGAVAAVAEAEKDAEEGVASQAYFGGGNPIGSSTIAFGGGDGTIFLLRGADKGSLFPGETLEQGPGVARGQAKGDDEQHR